MSISIAHHTTIAECIAQLKEPPGPAPRLVLFFASPQHPAGEVAAAFRDAFPSATVIGCTTAGEISSGIMSKGAIAAMGIPADVMPTAAAVAIQDLHSAAGVAAAISELGRLLGSPVGDLDPSQYVGILLVDGLSGAEEVLMERLGDLSDLPIVGGSAGDDLAFKKTFVSLDGTVHDGAAVLAVLHLPHGYRLVKTQSFRSTGNVLTATDVDERARTVKTFDGQPAGVAYAKALGVAPEQLAGEFMRHPLGLMVDGEPYVRSPQRVTDSGHVVFYCQIRSGMELEVLESTDMLSATAAALEGSGEPVAAIVNFHCILRTLELEANGQCAEYGRLFSGVPTVGFSTYGEEFMGHLNQTATMLLVHRATAESTN